ncbi:MAG: peptidylprolyl isomerase [Nibricoccus sp.]
MPISYLRVVAIASMLLFSCALIHAQTNPSSRSKTVALLEGHAVTESDFDRFLRGNLASGEIQKIQSDPASHRQILDEFFDLIALATKAKKDGLDQSIRFKKARELLEIKLLARCLQERLHSESLASIPRVDESELQDFYNQHRERFEVPARFTARHILVWVKGNSAFPEKGLDAAAARRKAEEARQKLQAGESWESVARDYSDDIASNQQGGLLAETTFGIFPPEFEAAIRQQKAGGCGEVIRTSFGYHVVRVEQYCEGKQKTFESVKTDIANDLVAKRQVLATKAAMKALRDEMGLVELPATDASTPSREREGNNVLAMLGGEAVREIDFQWFVRDAYRAGQRDRVLQKPGARQVLLQTYLDMRTLEAKAKQDGIDKQSDYADVYFVMEMRLLAEFLQERDKTNPWNVPAGTDAERSLALRNYLQRIRAEVGLIPYNEFSASAQ